MFSAINRTESIRQALERKYDLIIVGGGITGAGIALDAITRGLSCLLLEKQDFAAGTSSRSTKLIHGGLRYLKQLEVNLVREVGTERAIVHENAPHIVRPEPMLLPIIEKGSLGKRSTSLGLFVYDQLAGVEKSERRVMLNKEETLELEPLLKEDIVIGGGSYYEYQTDDARLTIEVLKSAAERGAYAFSYMEVVDFTYEETEADDKVLSGVKAVDRFTGEEHSFSASVIVNATGPWVDELRSKDGELGKKRLQLTKGVHIVVPYERLALRQAAYFDVGDGRMIFAIPREGTTYIGTTDTIYTEQLERPNVTREDVTYLLNAVNHMFPEVRLVMEDVVSSWAGLRPLIHQEGKSASELSRKDEIFRSENGVISIAGGKLTGYRKMAERTVDVVEKELYKREDRPVETCATENIVLSGGDLGAEPEDYAQQLFESVSHLPMFLGLTFSQVRSLVYKYGTNADVILEHVMEKGAEEHAHYPLDVQLLLSELNYGVSCEMVHTINDFFIRRSGKLYFERDTLTKYADVVLQELATILDLTEEECSAQKAAFLQEYVDVVCFKRAASIVK